jgi:hypothetical protein
MDEFASSDLSDDDAPSPIKTMGSSVTGYDDNNNGDG